MKIAVLGASGRTGQEFLQWALHEKHQVVAIVRTPQKIVIANEALQVSTLLKSLKLLEIILKN